MGDFVGGTLKYLRKHPLPRVTIAGGVAKMTKLAQGLLDLHSKRGTVDLLALATLAQDAGAPSVLRQRILAANTAAEAFAQAVQENLPLGDLVARAGWRTAARVIESTDIALEVGVFDRDGKLVGRNPFAPVHDALSSPKPAAIGRIVERALPEIIRRQARPTRMIAVRSIGSLASCAPMVGKRTAHDQLIRPRRARHHGDGTVFSVDRDQLADDPIDGLNCEVKHERRAGRGECVCSRSAGGMCEARPGTPRQNDALGDLRDGQLAAERAAAAANAGTPGVKV